MMTRTICSPNIPIAYLAQGEPSTSVHGTAACQISQNRRHGEEVDAVNAPPRTSLPNGCTTPQLLWVLAAKGSQLHPSPKIVLQMGATWPGRLHPNPLLGQPKASNWLTLWYRSLAPFSQRCTNSVVPFTLQSSPHRIRLKISPPGLFSCLL